MRFVFQHHRAGIGYHAGDRFDDAPPVSYPAKPTRLLFERYQHLRRCGRQGMGDYSCELIDYNGGARRRWCCAMLVNGTPRRHLSPGLTSANTSCSTPVDRIVTGYPRVMKWRPPEAQSRL